MVKIHNPTDSQRERCSSLSKSFRILLCCTNSTYWCDSEYIARWKEIKLRTGGCHVHSMLANRDILEKYWSTLDSVTKVTLKIWFIVVRWYGLEREIKILTWVAKDPKFKPATIDSSFENWTNMGITARCTMVDRGKIKNFQSLKRVYGLEDYDQFRYLQVNDFFEKDIRPELPQDLNKVTTTLRKACKNKSVKVYSVRTNIWSKYFWLRPRRQLDGNGVMKTLPL